MGNRKYKDFIDGKEGYYKLLNAIKDIDIDESFPRREYGFSLSSFESNNNGKIEIKKEKIKKESN